MWNIFTWLFSEKKCTDPAVASPPMTWNDSMPGRSVRYETFRVCGGGRDGVDLQIQNDPCIGATDEQGGYFEGSRIEIEFDAAGQMDNRKRWGGTMNRNEIVRLRDFLNEALLYDCGDPACTGCHPELVGKPPLQR